MELDEHGLLVWKHKTNKRLFLERPYRWVDRIFLLDETEGRSNVMEFKYSTFDFYAWEPMTKEEYISIVSNYKEIYKRENVIEAYLQGFEDELQSKPVREYDYSFDNRAYQLGRIDALIGDDVRSVDYQNADHLLKRIYNRD